MLKPLGVELALVSIRSFWVSALVKPLACQVFIAFADVAECMVTIANGIIPQVTLKTAIETFLAFVQALLAIAL